jgi:dipeptidyl aminopeptidase/acylaminoacyl peptidase
MVYVLRSLLLISVLASAFWGQDVMAPPADMVVDGVPPIPNSIAFDALPYRPHGSSSLIGWDPAKLRPIVKGRRTGHDWAVAAADSEKSRDYLAPLPRGYTDIYYEPNGKYFLYLKNDGESSQPQIYRYDIDSKASTLLTDGKSENWYPLWSTSGKLIAYSSARRNGTDLDVYIMDPLDLKSSHMVAEVRGDNWAPFAWSPDDGRLILSDYRSSQESYLWLLDLESGKRTPLTPAVAGQKAFNGSYAYFSKDGKGIYISTDRDSEFRRLAYLDLATGKRRSLTEGIPWDVDEFALSPDGRALAFVSNEDGTSRLHVMDTASYKELPLPDLPEAGVIVPGLNSSVVSGLRWHRSLPYLGFIFSSATHFSEVYSVNIASGKLDRWTRVPTAAGTQDPSEPEIVKWKSFDGRMISGYLYSPPKSFSGKRPVMINLRGALPFQFQPDFRAGDNYYINVLGIAMLYPNVRGSSGYGKTFMSLGSGPRRLDGVRDIGALLTWIGGQPDLDPGRIMLQGEYYGGYLALSTAAMYADKVRGVISFEAPTNLATFIERSGTSGQPFLRSEIGDERDKKTREFLDSIAPVNNADKISAPVLLIVGGKDANESVAETDHIVSRLKDRRIPVWYLLAKNEGYGFGAWRDLEYANDAQVLFAVQFLLGDASDGAPPVSAPKAPGTGVAGEQSTPAHQWPTGDEVLDR